MARPQKSLKELVEAGSFRARRPSHQERLAGPDLSWPLLAAIQRRWRAATSEHERRQAALAFEHAVKHAHAQAKTEQAAGHAPTLAQELAAFGPVGSAKSVIAFFERQLVHPKGPSIGQPFLLEPWQKRFIREFYKRDKKGRRVYRLGVLGIPRGNGKTALAAGLGLYELLSRADKPEVYFAAGSKDQARVMLSFARSFAEAGPLADWVTAKTTLSCPATGGTLRVISSEGALQHGLAPSAALVDELHAFTTNPQEETYHALTTALIKRPDSYLLAITTAGFDKRTLLGRIYDQALEFRQVDREHNDCLLTAKDEENGTLLWWYGVPADANLDDERLWRKANPASFVDLRDLRRHRHDPGLGEPNFWRLHTNTWTVSRDAWLPAGAWAALRSDSEIPDGAQVYIGVDVGLYHDTTAVSWAYKPKDGGPIIVCARVWSANPNAEAHVRVPGNKVQLQQVEQFILETLATRYDIREIAFDPHFFDRSAELLEAKGLILVEFLQTTGPLTDAAQRFYQLAVEERLTHNGDPVLAAHIDATAARPAERGWRLTKLHNSRVIDAAIAAVMAVARADINDHKPANPQIRFMEW